MSCCQQQGFTIKLRWATKSNGNSLYPLCVCVGGGVILGDTPDQAPYTWKRAFYLETYGFWKKHYSM